MLMCVNASVRNVMHLTSFLSPLIFIHSGSYIITKYHFVGYISISIYINILFVFKFDFKEGFMHIFVKCHLLDSFDALATNTQNVSRNVGTERRREISRTGRGIFVLSERTLDII